VDAFGLLKNTRAPDELYFPTYLAVLGELPQVEKPLDFEEETSQGTAAAGEAKRGELGRLAPNISGRRLTFCDWSGHSAKSPADLAWPAKWPAAEPGDGETEGAVEAGPGGWAAAALREGCLFARKFKPDAVGYAAWRRGVLGLEENEVSESELSDADDDQGDEEEAGSQAGLQGGSPAAERAERAPPPFQRFAQHERGRFFGGAEVGWHDNRNDHRNDHRNDRRNDRRNDHRNDHGGGGGSGGGGGGGGWQGGREHRGDRDRRRSRSRSRERDRSRSRERYGRPWGR